MVLPVIKATVTADTADAEAGFDRVGDSATRMGQEVRAASASVSAMRGPMRAAGGASGAFAAGVQNASFQVADFAVQVGMGTSAMRAMSMQLPQLLGGFGLWGAVAGGVVAVLGALVPALLGTGEEVDDLADKMKSLAEETEDARLKIFQLNEGLSSIAQARIAQEIKQTEAVILQIQKEIEEVQKKRSSGYARDLKNLRQELANHQSILAQQKAQLAESQKTALELERAELATKNIATGAGMIDFSSAISQATQLSTRLQQGAQNLFAMLQGFATFAERSRTVGRGRGDDPRMHGGSAEDIQKYDVAAQLAASEAAIAAERLAAAKVGGGGRAETLKEELSRQEEVFKEHVDRITALTEGGTADQLGAWGGYFDNLVQMTGTSNKRVLGLVKAFNSAQALMDAWGAYNRVLNSPEPMPWWARLAAGAQVLAAGLGAVNAINSVTGNGGGGGGGAGAPTAAAGGGGAAAPATSRNVAIQFSGGGMFSQEQVVGLINQINEAVEDGAIIRVV